MNAQAKPTIDLLSFIADGGRLEPTEPATQYRPHWNQLTGSVTATVFLSRLIDCWFAGGRRPFFKFSQPCRHPWYRQGESWAEELGMGRREFEHARGLIALRTHGTIPPPAYAAYWRDSFHLTWYAIDEGLLLKYLKDLGPQPEWLPSPSHRYRPPLPTLAVRIQFNSRRSDYYRSLVDRDGEHCRHCRTTQNLTIDHILAITNGGGNELDNLQLLCRSCNSRKGAR